MEKCKYCENGQAIKNSHAIPSFIYKWLRDTSTNGFMRATNEPNQRLQDGPRSPLLCTKCELLFSKFENKFKTEFFSKVANYRKPYPEILPITESTKKCISIISWRVLADTYFFPKENEYTKDEFDKFPSILKQIKESIQSSETTDNPIHLIPCTQEILIRLNLPKVDFFYYDRTIGAEPRIWDDWQRLIIFIKIPFSIIVFEAVPGKNDPWVGTRIDNVDSIHLSGILSVPDYVAPQINKGYKSFLESNDRMSPEQKKKIMEDAVKSDKNCGSFKTMSKVWP